MKIFNLLIPGEMISRRSIEQYLVGITLFLAWFTAQRIMQANDITVGVVDPSIWMLVLMSLICFVTLSGISYWLLKRFAAVMGMPTVGILVGHFNALEIWQQLSFYWASFALLLLAGVGSLSAIL